jgi:hypothetical protein
MPNAKAHAKEMKAPLNPTFIIGSMKEEWDFSPRKC